MRIRYVRVRKTSQRLAETDGDAPSDALPGCRALAAHRARGARFPGRRECDLRSPRRRAVPEPGRAERAAAGYHHAVHRLSARPRAARGPGRTGRALAIGSAATG